MKKCKKKKINPNVDIPFFHLLSKSLLYGNAVDFSDAYSYYRIGHFCEDCEQTSNLCECEKCGDCYQKKCICNYDSSKFGIRKSIIKFINTKLSKQNKSKFFQYFHTVNKVIIYRLGLKKDSSLEEIVNKLNDIDV